MKVISRTYALCSMWLVFACASVAACAADKADPVSGEPKPTTNDSMDASADGVSEVRADSATRGLDILARAQAIYAVGRILQERTSPGAATDQAFAYGSKNYTNDVYGPSSSVDGVLLRFGWGALEPLEKGVYDFRQILYETKRAARAGKKIQISIVSGTLAPEWLCPSGDQQRPHASCAAGAVPAYPHCFQSYDGSHDGLQCRCRRVTVPWAAEVRTSFQNMLRALKLALTDTDNGGMTKEEFDLVRLVRANGINYQTEELKLPNGAEACDSKAEITDAWRAAPQLYSAAKIVNAWEENTRFITDLFPGVASSSAVTGDSFPDDPDVPKTTAFVVNQIQNAILKDYPGRIFMQVNALAPAFSPKDLLAARDKGIPIAFQTNTWLGSELGARCGTGLADSTMCSDLGAGSPTFYDLLNRGLCLGGNYLEIFAADAPRFPKSIRAARALPFGVVSCRP